MAQIDIITIKQRYTALSSSASSGIRHPDGAIDRPVVLLIVRLFPALASHELSGSTG
jgi:hypothetical protein